MAFIILLYSTEATTQVLFTCSFTTSKYPNKRYRLLMENSDTI